MVEHQGKGLGLVSIKNRQFEFNHELFMMNGKNTRLNPVLRHLIKEVAYFIQQTEK